ncbi:aspartate/glutamate racemase family protein [Roseivirga sp. E12]|uniref:aspartate/glutamate racemase family protein n=1 Tax=Roseivirga sp. E12 TaxID=2819237 RepID=UPI001ABC0604|nr:amino acid racemase [Roseivirga sp. E12]MBO3697691.1 amino acid racemase [Roseivirga sp. E12]
MKTVGLIGGMSWESSKMYYQYANEYVKHRLGGSHSCKCVMVSVDFAEIEKYTFAGQWDKIGEMMAKCTRQLEAAGADIIVLCTNTIHLVSDYIEKSTDLPFLHIAEATGKSIKDKGLQKVGLIGTKFTMEKDFYTSILSERFGLDVIIPSKDDRQAIHDIIYNELVKSQFTEVAKIKCMSIMESLASQGAQGIIMGCTELPILVPDSDVDIVTIDTTKVHIQQAVDWAIQ